MSSQTTLEDVFDRLRGGSSVSFYFSGHLHVEVDEHAARQVMFDDITRCGELVLGYPAGGGSQLEMATISGPSELTECLILHPEGSLVVWGEWPTRANDGQDAITVDLVDVDGILRPHPH